MNSETKNKTAANPRPTTRPLVPNFSSGPCAKRPGWSPAALADALVGRSHRSAAGRAKLAEVLSLSREVLAMPADYRLGILPGSDTGAVEAALWSLLGERGVDLLAWESFGKGWVVDVSQRLGLKDLRVFEADYGQLPDLAQVDGRRDIVFTWNGTTSGVRVPDGEWIPAARDGLTICDATSAVFAMALPWHKLDVVTWSWQKVLGGEAAHGMIALSPRAVRRLERHRPAWPVPKLFQLATGGKPIDGIFKGDTINTPSMLCVEDALDGLRWARSIGGLPALVRRSEANLGAIVAWLARTPWLDFLAEVPATRSSTSVCLKITAPSFRALDEKARRAALAQFTDLLETEGVAYDINGYREAPPGLRLWAGATVETADLQALFPWLDWAYDQVLNGR
ncbi:MAG: phosphoserine transaminase [Dongiaceae bacterium]